MPSLSPQQAKYIVLDSCHPSLEKYKHHQTDGAPTQGLDKRVQIHMTYADCVLRRMFGLKPKPKHT